MWAQCDSPRIVVVRPLQGRALFWSIRAPPVLAHGLDVAPGIGRLTTEGAEVTLGETVKADGTAQIAGGSDMTAHSGGTPWRPGRCIVGASWAWDADGPVIRACPARR